MLDHDARASDENVEKAEFGEDACNETSNLSNFISLHCTRFRPTASGRIETVEPHAHTLSDDSLCDPHCPIFMENTLDSSSPVLGNCEPCTVFSASKPIYAFLGPRVTNTNVFTELRSSSASNTAPWTETGTIRYSGTGAATCTTFPRAARQPTSR